jgi:outer membrane protein assembly factor BamB
MRRPGAWITGTLLALGASLTAGPPTAAAATVSADWPTFKGNNARLGQGPALSLPVKQLWKVHLGGSLYSSPAIQDGLVLLGSSDKHLTALDLSDGKTRWSKTLPDRIWGSAPAIAGGLCYIGCVDGCVHALALADGKEAGRWCGHPHGLMGKADVLSSPLVEGGRLVFGSDDGCIYGAELAGTAVWKAATGDIIHDNAACAVSGTAFIPSQDGKLYALALADGARRWAWAAPKPFNTVPSCANGLVYVGDGDSKVYALDASDGKLRWSFATGGRGIMASPSLGPDHSLVIGSTDHFVYCLDAESGALRWKAKTGDVVLASALITGSLVWLGSFDEKFRALDLKTGEERWSTELEGGVFTSAAASGDKIVVAGRGGDVICLQATAAPAVQP